MHFGAKIKVIFATLLCILASAIWLFS